MNLPVNVSISELAIVVDTYSVMVFHFFFFLQEQLSLQSDRSFTLDVLDVLQLISLHILKRFLLWQIIATVLREMQLFLINALIAYRARICLKCGAYNVSLIARDPYRFVVR